MTCDPPPAPPAHDGPTTAAWLRRGLAILILLASIPAGRWPMPVSLPPGATVVDCATLTDPRMAYPAATQIRCIRTADGVVMVDALFTEDSPSTIRQVYTTILAPNGSAIGNAPDGSHILWMPIQCGNVGGGCSQRFFRMHVHRCWCGSTLVTFSDPKLDRIRVSYHEF